MHFSDTQPFFLKFFWGLEKKFWVVIKNLCLDNRHETHDLVYSLIPSYILCPAHGAKGFSHTIYQCHQASFLDCLPLIDPCHCKPHQKAFLSPTKELGILFQLSIWNMNHQLADQHEPVGHKVGKVILIYIFPYLIFYFSKRASSLKASWPRFTK